MAARVTTSDLVSRLLAEQDGQTGRSPRAGGPAARAVHSGKADTVLGGLGVTDVTGHVASGDATTPRSAHESEPS